RFSELSEIHVGLDPGTIKHSSLGRIWSMTARFSWNQQNARSFALGIKDAGERSSVDFDAVPELLVLVADELNQFLVGKVALVYTNSERFSVGLWIVNRDVDLEMTERGAPNSFGEFHLLAVRTAVDIQPTVEWTVFRSAQVVGLDHECVAFPVPDR